MTPPPRPVASWNPLDALTPTQRNQLIRYRAHLLGFNQKLNLVSRESARHADERHVLHSLMLTWKPFPSGCTVVDWGTGGGLPGIPLAICFPDVTFHLVDSVRKKILAVQVMVRRLGLTNVQAWHGRAETWPGRAAYSVSRATAPLHQLWAWHLRVGRPPTPEAEQTAWPPGLICLKGGDLSEETALLQHHYPDVQVHITPLTSLLPRAHFSEKALVSVSGA